MPSFDVVSEVDLQEVSNAVDQSNREISTRYDFKGSCARIEHNKEALNAQADSDFQLRQVKDILHMKLAKRGIDLQALQAGKIEENNRQVRQTLTVQQGISQDVARKIVKQIKDAKMKVQASIQGDKVRITGKKRDDLQAAIALLKEASLDLPLQYVNFRD